jgi:hypothetical protein
MSDTGDKDIVESHGAPTVTLFGQFTHWHQRITAGAPSDYAVSGCSTG